MEAITPALLAVGCVNLFMFPMIVWALKRFVGKKLDTMDENREMARAEQRDAERRFAEQREAERTIILAMSRTMLLNNYERCIKKGYYTVDEREVYHKLYEAYKSDGGNSVIDDIAPRIRELPFEPPKH